MLPFGVTIPATVPQRSEIPEGLTNYSVFGVIFTHVHLGRHYTDGEQRCSRWTYVHGLGGESAWEYVENRILISRRLVKITLCIEARRVIKVRLPGISTVTKSAAGFTEQYESCGTQKWQRPAHSLIRYRNAFQLRSIYSFLVLRVRRNWRWVIIAIWGIFARITLLRTGTLDATEQILVALATWSHGLVHPCFPPFFTLTIHLLSLFNSIVPSSLF